MRSKAYQRSLIVLFSLAVFLFGYSLQSFAVMKDDPPLLSPSAVEISQGNVSYWRPFLWEAIPSEWLRDAKQGVLLEYYQQHDWQPFFVDSRFEVNEGAQIFLQRLEKLESDGINPKPYQLEALRKSVTNLEQARAALQAVDPKFQDSLANLGEISPTDSFRDSRTGSPPIQVAMDSPQQVRPANDPSQKKDREHKYREAFRAASELDIKLTHDLIRLARELNPFSGEMQMKALAGQIPMAQFLKELEPNSPHYEPLHQAFSKYKHLSAQGGQVPFQDKGTVKLGESGNHIRNLQKRLQQEGFYTGKITGSYDTATQQAIQQFQRSHLLEPDGAIGQKTKEWLNVPFAMKAKMITESMKVLRQSNTRVYDRYIQINIPQFMLEYHKGGKVQNVQRVIVGKAAGKKIKLNGKMIGENHTPTLSSQIENVILNPRWYITDRIRRELADTISDPAYFAKHGYVQMAHRLFQLPGPTNPLGRVKFEFANDYAVFLHDTPKKQLFDRSRRDFSHGCVRLEGALTLAQVLLQDDQNPAVGKTKSYLESNRQTYIKLQQPVPIIIEYLPAITNGNGQLLFCGDPYGWMEEGNQKS